MAKGDKSIHHVTDQKTRDERGKKIAELRDKGKTYKEISQILKVPESNVIKSLDDWKRKHNVQRLEKWKEDLIQKYDYMYSKLEIKIKKGDVQAIEQGRKLLKDKWEITGIKEWNRRTAEADAPSKPSQQVNIQLNLNSSDKPKEVIEVSTNAD
jgi:transcriptional regulator